MGYPPCKLGFFSRISKNPQVFLLIYTTDKKNKASLQVSEDYGHLKWDFSMEISKNPQGFFATSATDKKKDASLHFSENYGKPKRYFLLKY